MVSESFETFHYRVRIRESSICVFIWYLLTLLEKSLIIAMRNRAEKKRAIMCPHGIISFQHSTTFNEYTYFSCSRSNPDPYNFWSQASLISGVAEKSVWWVRCLSPVSSVSSLERFFSVQMCAIAWKMIRRFSNDRTSLLFYLTAAAATCWAWDSARKKTVNYIKKYQIDIT